MLVLLVVLAVFAVPGVLLMFVLTIMRARQAQCALRARYGNSVKSDCSVCSAGCALRLNIMYTPSPFCYLCSLCRQCQICYVVAIAVFEAIVLHVVLGVSLCSLCSSWESGLHFVSHGCNDNSEGTMRSCFFFWPGQGCRMSLSAHTRRGVVSCPNSNLLNT